MTIQAFIKSKCPDYPNAIVSSIKSAEGFSFTELDSSVGFFLDAISDEKSKQMIATIVVVQHENPDDDENVNGGVVNVKMEEETVSNEEEETIFSSGQEVGVMVQDNEENNGDKPDMGIPDDNHDNDYMGMGVCGDKEGCHEKSGAKIDASSNDNKGVLIMQHEQVNKTKASAAGKQNEVGAARMKGVCDDDEEQNDQGGLEDESEEVVLENDNDSNIATSDEEESKEKNGDSAAPTLNVKQTKSTCRKPPAPGLISKLRAKKARTTSAIGAKKVRGATLHDIQTHYQIQEALRNINKEFRGEPRFSAASILGLGEASVDHLDGVFQGANECAKHSKRKTVMRKDFDLVHAIWKKNGMI